MLKNFISRTTLFLLILNAAPSKAEEKGKFYIGGSLGTVFAGNTRADGIFTSTGSVFDGQRLGPSPGETVKGKFDPSITTSLSFGYDLGKRKYGRLRFEGELFYQRADTDKYDGILDGTVLNPSGRVDTNISGIVFNTIYDIGQFNKVTPYVYLGYGRGNVEMNYDFPERGIVKIDGSSEIIQGGFGIEIPYNERTNFDVKYRFRRAGLGDNGLDADIDAQGIEFGMRYTF